MVKTAGRRRKTSRRSKTSSGRRHRGGSYTVNVAAAPAGGFPQIDSNRMEQCGSVDNRFGNNTFGGKRRKTGRRHSKKTGRRSKTSSGGRRRYTVKRGGYMNAYPGQTYPTSDLALSVARTGYGYQGTGVAGFADYPAIY
jgi:hypothetical protein